MELIKTKLTFPGSAGTPLAALLEEPEGTATAYAIFAHCFTCSKDISAATRISRALAAQKIGVLRFDFTGLGNSEGDFSNTDFTSNVEDLLAAADFMGKIGKAPKILVGHSLGGAAVLAAGERIPSVIGVSTIGAPSDPSHVSHLFESDISQIQSQGFADVSLVGRKFRIRKEFIDDLANQKLEGRIRSLGKALLVFHSPVDQIVGIENARKIFELARHPKSFISLHKADHLLTNTKDSEYVGLALASWASRYLQES